MSLKTKKIIIILIITILTILHLPLNTVSYSVADGTKQPSKNEGGSVLEETGITLEDLAREIQEFEGDYDNSRSDLNNNPGNLRYSPIQDGTQAGFAYFNTEEKGWRALILQLESAACGTSSVYNPDMTLYDFFNVYAPTIDDNSPNHYAKIVIRNLGVDDNFKIKEMCE